MNSSLFASRCLLICAGCLLAASWSFSEAIKVSVSRDTWISSVGSERTGNNGASPRLKMKGIQEFSLVDFDPTPFRGKTVTKATLHLHLANNEALKRVTVSSLPVPWQEGTGTNYEKLAGAACFALPGTQPDITSAILGQGGSVWGWGDATPPDEGGWQAIPVASEVIQARIDGRSEGFVLIDDLGNEWSRKGDQIDWRLFPNRYFHSRDQSSSVAPYFTIEFKNEAPKPPQPPPACPLPEETVFSLPPPEPVSTDGPWTGLWGEKLSQLCLARGEAGWITLDSPALPVVSSPPDLQTKLYPIGAHADALGVRSSTETLPTRWLLEVRVGKKAVAGSQSISLNIEGQSKSLPIIVWDFTLPDVLSFVPQMNGYGLPGHELAYYRLAHEHRTCLNILRYSWKGHPAEGCVPQIRPDGSWDWTAWDLRFGPLLDGSAFADSPRGAVPVDAFYLPLNENWPMNHEKLYRGGYWADKAYDDSYWQQLRDASHQFAQHFAEKKWSKPVFEFYLNNKVYFKADRKSWNATSATWIFDEPVNAQDFWALRVFGREFFAGVGDLQRELRLAFRCDISRPEWQRDFLDGLCMSEVQSGALRRYAERSAQRQERFGHRVYMYGSAHPIGSPQIQAAAWALESWLLGADGLVPWQTIGTDNSWTTPEATCLFYPAENGPIPALRLKSMTAAQQLIEYLTLFQQTGHSNRKGLAQAVQKAISLASNFKKTSEDDAGTLEYSAELTKQLISLRLTLGKWLDQRKPPFASSLNEWRPPVVNLRQVPHHECLVVGEKASEASKR